jgi:hypothetical protein
MERLLVSGDCETSSPYTLSREEMMIVVSSSSSCIRFGVFANAMGQVFQVAREDVIERE